jgi:HEAT repeat protein
MRDAPDHARIALAGIVGAAGGTAAVKLLSQFAHAAKDGNVAAAATTALGRTAHPSALPFLVEVLESGDEWLQFAAVSALGELGDSRAVPAIERLVQDSFLQEAAAVALVEIGTIDAVRALAGNLYDQSGALREPVLSAMASLYHDERLVPKLYSDQIRREIAESFRARVGPNIAINLVLIARSSNSARARYAITALGWLGDSETALVLIEALKDPSLTKSARQALADFARTESGLSALRNCLQYGLSDSEFLTAVGGIESVCAVEAVLDVLHSTQDADIIDSCMSILGSLREWLSLYLNRAGRAKDADLIASRLLEVMVQGPTRILAEIALTLAAIPQMASSSSARKTVLGLLGESSHPDRLKARLSFLEMVRVEQAVREAFTALSNSDAVVRIRAIEIIGKHCADAASLVLHAADESTGVRRAVMRALRNSAPAPKVFRTLSAALADSDIWVRAEAIKTLGEVFSESDDSLLALRHELASAHPLCRVAAVQALSAHSAFKGVSGSEDSHGPATWKAIAEVAAADPQAEVRRVATLALAVCPIPELKRRVARAGLSDMAWPTQRAAVELLMSDDSSLSTKLLYGAATDMKRNAGVRGLALRGLALRAYPSALGLVCANLCSDNATLIEDAYVAARMLSASRPAKIDSVLTACPPRAASILMFVAEVQKCGDTGRANEGGLEN